MGCPEGIADEVITEGGEVLGQLRLVGSLSGQEPDVFQEDHIPIPHAPDLLLELGGSGALGEERYFHLQEPSQRRRHRPQRIGGVHTSLGSTQVGDQDCSRPGVPQVPECGKRRPEAGVVPYLTVGRERDVEIDPDQDPGPPKEPRVQIRQRRGSAVPHQAASPVSRRSPM